ncbi:MAG: hypothetical protein MR543_10160 [Robinsoniella sp.]|nr:hypothetical protein [Robinsoniella sp.]
MKYKIVKSFFGISVALCTLYGSIHKAYFTPETYAYSIAAEESSALSQAETSAPAQSSEDSEVIPSPNFSEEDTPQNQTDAFSSSRQNSGSNKHAKRGFGSASESASDSSQSLTPEKSGPAESGEQITSPSDSGNVQDASISEVPSSDDTPSLEEYLSKLRCGGCGRNCTLLNPRCHNGNRKAVAAQEQYYATY